MNTENPLLNKALENLKAIESQLVEETRILSGIHEKECDANEQLSLLKNVLLEKERVIAELSARLGEEKLRLEKETAGFSETLAKVKENFETRERELVRENRALREEAGALSRELERSAREAQETDHGEGRLKAELEAARVRITEQAVLATTSVSALRELRSDVDRLNSEAARKSEEAAALKARGDILAAELREERQRTADTQRKLAEALDMAAGARAQLQDSLRREEVFKRKTGALNMDLRDKSSIIAYLTKEAETAKALLHRRLT